MKEGIEKGEKEEKRFNFYHKKSTKIMKIFVTKNIYKG
jgi:hypothetical protein